MRGNELMAGLAPSHPGEILREDILPAAGLTRTALAARLGLSRQTLHAILSGEAPVTYAVALRLGRLFGNSPAFWSNLQGAYSLWHEGRRMAEQLDAIEPLEASV